MSQEKVRIRWFTPDKPSNISVGRQRIATHLRDDGFTVDIVGTTVETVLTALRERRQYDVVVGTTRAGALAGTAIGYITGKPVVVDHVDPIQQFWDTRPLQIAAPVQLAENVTFALADAVLYVYQKEAARVTRYASKTQKTDLGVDYERFADPDAAIVQAARNRLDDITTPEKVVIYVGGLEPIYHVEELLEAMSHLPDWSLVVVGDGSLRDAAEEAASESENVHYLGTVSHKSVPGYLHAADVGVSLVDDPHTLKVLEYGAAGLPVVQVKGQAEKRFGDMVEYCDLDPEHIADAIEQAGSREPDGALRSFAAEYDWREIAGDYKRMITALNYLK